MTRGLALASLAAVTSLAFCGVVQNGWINLDDPLYVYENRRITGGLSIESALWFLVHPHGANWHPLTSWSHMLDVQLFGLAPAGHHAVSLALHVLNAVFLVLVVSDLTGAWWRSLIVGALFAVHPLRVESVAWASERKDVLSGLVFLLTIAAYRRWVDRPVLARRALVVLLYGLGLMAKPMLVTVPFVLLLLDAWPLGRLGPAPGVGVGRARLRRLMALVAEKAPLLALAAVSAVVTYFVQRHGGAMTPVEHLPLWARLANAAVSCWRYVGDTLWPTYLSPLYPFTRVPSPVAAALAAGGLAIVTSVVLVQARARPYLAVGWLWYVGMLAPVIGVVQVGAQSHADRYTYLPVIGLAIAGTWGIGEMAGRCRKGRVLAAVACFLACAALAFSTARQVARWRDSRTLWAHALSVAEDNPFAHAHVADALLRDGDAQAAVQHYEEAVRRMPQDPGVLGYLGVALTALGRHGEAVVRFREALIAAQSTRVTAADTAELHHNLGFAYAHQGKDDEAIREYEVALRFDPDLAEALVHLGAALTAQGRFDEAERHLRRALTLDKRDLDANRFLAIALLRQGRVEEALQAYGELLRSNADDLDALTNVAWVRAVHADSRHRNGPEAVRLAERARDRSPRPVAQILSTLAAAYAETARFEDAIHAAEEACALARDAGNAGLVEACERQLAAYRAGRPFRITE